MEIGKLMPIGNDFKFTPYGINQIETANGKNVANVTIPFCNRKGADPDVLKTDNEGVIITGTFYLYTDSQRIYVKFLDNNGNSAVQNTYVRYKNATTGTNNGNYSNASNFPTAWWSHGNDTGMAGSSHTNDDDSVARVNLIMFVNGGYTGDTLGTTTSPAVWSGGYGMTNFVSSGGNTHMSHFGFTLQDDYASSGQDTYDQVSNQVQFYAGSGNIDYDVSVFAFQATGGNWE